jgi:hypothetical protein
MNKQFLMDYLLGHRRYFVLLGIILAYLFSFLIFKGIDKQIIESAERSKAAQNKVLQADNLFLKKGEIATEKIQIEQQLYHQALTEEKLIKEIKAYLNKNDITIDLIDTFTVLREFRLVDSKLYIFKLKFFNYAQMSLFLEFLEKRAPLKVLKYEYNEGYGDIRVQVLVAKEKPNYREIKLNNSLEITKPLPPLKLTAIISDKGVFKAVINGQTLIVGNKLEDCTLREINYTGRYVVFNRGAQTWRAQLRGK